MTLSPIDIEQKTFRVALRGYAEEEVDQFLDEIVIAFRDYERQLRDANERVAVLEEQLEANRETEERIKKTLMIAQRTADEVVQESRREAQQILVEARTQASEIEVERIQERETLVADLDRLRAAVADVKDRLSGLTDRTLVDLGAIEEDIVAAHPAWESADETPIDTGVDQFEHDPEGSWDAEGWSDEPADEHQEEFEEKEEDEGSPEGSGQAYLGSTRRPWERDTDL